MKLIEKVIAYKAIREMMKENWDFDFIYYLMRLMHGIEADYDFFCNEEMKLVAAYGKKEANGKVAIDPDGVFSFTDEEAMCCYQKAHQKLTEMKTSAPEKIALCAPLKMRGEWLLAIEPFCSFQKEGSSDE